MRTIITLILALTATAHSALTIVLPGTSESDGWIALGTGYAGNTWAADGYPTSYPGLDPWTPGAVAANKPGSTGGAVLNKISGNGYFSSSSIYDAGGAGVFSVSDVAPISGLQTVIFEIDAGGPVGLSPVLNYNGGSQQLAAAYATETTGDYTAFSPVSGPYATTNYAWQWDLSSVGPVTSYEIVYGSVVDDHLTQYEINATTGDTFNQVVPEPSALLLSLAGLAFSLRRRR